MEERESGIRRSGWRWKTSIYRPPRNRAVGAHLHQSLRPVKVGVSGLGGVSGECTPESPAQAESPGQTPDQTPDQIPVRTGLVTGVSAGVSGILLRSIRAAGSSRPILRPPSCINFLGGLVGAFGLCKDLISHTPSKEIPLFIVRMS